MFTIGNLRDFFESLPRFDMYGFDLREAVLKRMRGDDDKPIGGQLDTYYSGEAPVIFSPKIGVLLGDDLKYVVDAKSLSKTSVFIRVSCYCGYMSGDLATRSGIIPKGKYKTTLREELDRQYKVLFTDLEKAIEKAFGRPDTASKNGTFICKRLRNVKPEFKVLTGYMGNLACVRLTFTMNFAPAVVASKRAIIESKKLTANTMLTNHQLGKLFEVLYDKDCEFFGISSDDFADLSDYYIEDEERPIKQGGELVFNEAAHGSVVEYNIVHGDPDVSIDVDANGDRVIVSFMASVGMLDLETINADDLSEPMSMDEYSKYAKADAYSAFSDYVKPFERDLKTLKGVILREAGLKLTRTQAVYDYDEEDAAYFTCIAYFDVV